jgi:putative transposase
MHGIKARSTRELFFTSDSKHDLPTAENLLARDFAPAAPDPVWSSDMHCAWRGSGVGRRRD